MTESMRQDELVQAIQFILENLDNTRRVVRHAYAIRKELVDLAFAGEISEKDFYRISSVLTPQSRSAIWQNYFIKTHGGLKVKASKNRGDFESNGTFYEHKASGFNEDNLVHIVQIRLWQNCDYIVQSISDDGTVTFILEHQEMKFETEIIPATAAHGTKRVTDERQHVELRMRFRRESDIWIRWIDQYTNRVLKRIELIVQQQLEYKALSSGFHWLHKVIVVGR